MGKKYENKENTEENILREPITEYKKSPKMTFSPPLTEEERAKAITGDELREYMHTFIDELFDKNKDPLHS